MYRRGFLKIERIPNAVNRVAIVCNGGVSRTGVDHQQLIYEALEIAAHSKDAFAADFAAFRDELLQLTEDWDD